MWYKIHNIKKEQIQHIETASHIYTDLQQETNGSNKYKDMRYAQNFQFMVQKPTDETMKWHTNEMNKKKRAEREKEKMERGKKKKRDSERRKEVK